MAKSPAARRYLRRFIPTTLAYVVAVFGTSYAVHVANPGGAVLVALSILPALPILGMLLVIGLYLYEETDEFVRQRIVIAMLFGIGVLLAAASVLGFLQIYKVIGAIDVFWAFPVWCAAWGAAQCILSLRDRITGGGQ